MMPTEDQPRNIFTRIYETGLWGRSGNPDHTYYSGAGSHDPNVVKPYVAAVRTFLQFHRVLLGHRPDVVDLGCGDFSVGSQLRDHCRGYVACDVAEPVILWNREKYADLKVDFRSLDFLSDALPDGDVVFIRQVLQHLSNDQILTAIPRIVDKYRFLVLTEHLPVGETFVPNLDKPTGADIRLGLGSGIVVTSPPFDLEVADTLQLCAIPGYGGVLRTLLYRLG